MAQYALPIIDDVEVDWTEGAGNGDANHFDEFDEGFGVGRGSGSGPDDATTYWNKSVMSTGFVNFIGDQLSTVTDPLVSSGHIYRTRNAKSASAGKQVDIKTRLWQAGPFVEMHAETYTNVDNIWTTRAITLTGTEADSITRYDALFMDTDARNVGGGAARTAFESAHEFECPDAGPTVTQPYMRRTGGVPGMRADKPGSIFGRSWFKRLAPALAEAA